MKYKTTNKEIKEGYCKIISIGYCVLQCLLRHQGPIAYNKGVYGWNYDVYDFGNIAIVTGYRSMVFKNCKTDYKIVREFEEKARRIVDKRYKYETEKKKINALLEEFINLH